MPPRTRLLVPSTETIRAPESIQEWNRLMMDVISRAESLEDRRLPGLRKALVDGKAETHLRKLGVISPADVEREFPLTAK